VECRVCRDPDVSLDDLALRLPRGGAICAACLRGSRTRVPARIETDINRDEAALILQTMPPDPRLRKEGE
jgi:hypothetical protein